MKDEIKEILEALKPHDEEFTKVGIKEYPLVLSVKEQKILLDYITNLQTIEQQYSAILSENAELQSKVMKLKDELEKQRREYQETYKDVRIELKEKNETITNLQEENKNLTHIVANKIIEDYDIDTPLKNQLNEERIKYINLGVVCNDYKSRNKKAIEYIKKNTRTAPFENYKYLQIDDEEIEELENILNGGDDNE